MPIKPCDVIDYWIGDVDRDPILVRERSKLWYGSSKKIDNEINDKFGKQLLKAESGELEQWESSIEGQLALVIMFDQFTRNLNRGSKDAWKNDSLALEIAEAAITNQRHHSLSIFERVFLYHPFHHSESSEAQTMALTLFEALQETVEPQWQEPLTGFTNFVKNHNQIIQQFGRFPHRNEALQRQSTPEETKYLTKNTRKYGQ